MGRPIAFLMMGLLSASFPPAASEEADSSYKWSEQFRAYDLLPMDPAALLDDLSDGEGTLALLGALFPIVVATVPWTVSPPVFIQAPDGSLRELRREFESVGLRGSVLGIPSSKVLLTITEYGVSGYVSTPDIEIHFDPLGQFDPRSARETVLVYNIRDYVHPPRSSPLLALDATPGEGMPRAGDLPPQHTNRPNVEHTEWANQAFLNDAGSGWHAFLDIRMNAVNDIISTNLNYHYARHQVIGCDNAACDSSWGMGGRGVNMLSSWGQRVLSNGPRESASLHSGWTNGDGVDGRAFRAGRYSAEDVPVGTANSYARKVLAHELIHNVNSDHAYAAYWEVPIQYNHPHTVCDLSLLGFCLRSHAEDHTHTRTEKHYTLDNTDGNDDPVWAPDTDEVTEVWETFIAEGNLVRIDACKGTEAWYDIPYTVANLACP